MARGRRLYRLAAILFVAGGIMTATLSSPASASTGAGGLPILYASTGDQAHKCNVIGDDGLYQAVICSDLVTAEDSTNYDVHGRAEAICQTSSTPHVVVACKNVDLNTSLATGNGSVTRDYGLLCGGDAPCPDGRFYVSTPNWVYSIAGAGGCSSNTGSAYDQWDVVWGSSSYLTYIETPDRSTYYYLDYTNANDGYNESTGHYFICP